MISASGSALALTRAFTMSLTFGRYQWLSINSHRVPFLQSSSYHLVILNSNTSLHLSLQTLVGKSAFSHLSLSSLIIYFFHNKQHRSFLKIELHRPSLLPLERPYLSASNVYHLSLLSIITYRRS